MAELHGVPGSELNLTRRLLNQLVAGMTRMHPDERLAQRWEAMAAETVRRYPDTPNPSPPLPALSSVYQELEAHQREKLEQEVAIWVKSYHDAARHQLLGMHRDIVLLQRRIIELEAGQAQQ